MSIKKRIDTLYLLMYVCLNFVMLCFASMDIVILVLAL